MVRHNFKIFNSKVGESRGNWNTLVSIFKSQDKFIGSSSLPKQQMYQAFGNIIQNVLTRTLIHAKILEKNQNSVSFVEKKFVAMFIELPYIWKLICNTEKIMVA